MEEALSGGGDVEEEARVPPHAREVQLDEVLRSADLLVFVLVPEPPRADRDIGLAGTPHAALRIPVQERTDDSIAADSGVRHRGGIDRAPVRVARDPLLVPDPADVGSRIREDDRLRLEPADDPMDTRPVVRLSLSIRPLAVGTIEPDFHDGTVAGEQLGELSGVEVVIPRRVAVRRVVPVPGGEIESDAEPFRATRLRELAHHVAPSLAPRARAHRVIRGLRRPEAKAIVVLGGEDHRSESARSCRARPLPGIEARRVEDAGILGPVPPFATAERVDGEVNEHRELGALPGELLGRGARALGDGH